MQPLLIAISTLWSHSALADDNQPGKPTKEATRDAARMALVVG